MTQQIVDVEEKREGELWEGRQHRGIIIYFLLIIPILIASIVIFVNWANEGNICASVAICGDSLVILALIIYILTNLSQRPSIVLFEGSVTQKSKDGKLKDYPFSEIKKLSVQRYYAHGKNDFGAIQIKGKKNLYFGGLPNPTTFIDKASQLDGLKGKLEVKDYRGRIMVIFILFYGILALMLISFIITSISSTIKTTGFDYGNWSAINTGIAATEVDALAVDPKTPGTLYASVGGGMYKTTDYGSSWNALTNGLTNTQVSAIAIDPVTPATLYAGTDGGVYKSTDGGENWSSYTTDMTNHVYMLVIDPRTPTTLYAGTDAGVYKSTNSGENWNAFASGLPTDDINKYIFAVVIDPVTPTTLYAGTNTSVYKSMDGGENWSESNNGFNNKASSFAINSATPTTLYVGGDGGVYKSTNGGESWSKVNLDERVFALAIDPLKPDTLYAGTDDAVYMSTNGGGSWRRIGNGMGRLTDVTILAIDPLTPANLYAGTEEGGVFVSHGPRVFPAPYSK